jgi:perosamine synthetase
MPSVNNRIYGNEKKYVVEVLSSEFRSSKGSTMMSRLEDLFAQRFKSKCAMEAHGIRPGDEIIVPPLTMSATSFAVLQCNATPVFADVDSDTFQISPSSIEDCITIKTKAIITVALYGLSPDMDAIMEIADKYNLLVIEDNAQCFLGGYKGRIAGTTGHCASFSFQSSKHITSGEGGMIITNDLNLAEKIRKVQSLGYAGVSATKGKISKLDIQDPNYSRHVTMGWNYRMPEVCCAIALAQLENIDALVDKRKRSAKYFMDASGEYKSWFIPQKVGENYEHSYWTWAVKLENPDISWHEFRDRFINFGGDGIYAAWQLSYLEPMFQKMNLLGREAFISRENTVKYRKGSCPNAERLQPKLLQFKTNYWNLNDAEKQADILNKTLSSF